MGDAEDSQRSMDKANAAKAQKGVSILETRLKQLHADVVKAKAKLKKANMRVPIAAKRLKEAIKRHNARQARAWKKAVQKKKAEEKKKATAQKQQQKKDKGQKNNKKGKGQKKKKKVKGQKKKKKVKGQKNNKKVKGQKNNKKGAATQLKKGMPALVSPKVLGMQVSGAGFK